MRFIFCLLILCVGSFVGCNAPEKVVKKEKKSTAGLFLGNWRISNEAGDFFYITINPDGTATSTWDKGQTGKWESNEEKVIIDWADGWRDIILIQGGGFKKEGYEPGQTNNKPKSVAKAERM